MRHDTLTGLLTDYVAGELEQEVRERLEHHAEECEACRAWVDTAGFLEETLACEHQSSSTDLARFATSPETVEEPERLRIEQHLEVCEPCRKELDLVRRSIHRARRRPLGQRISPVFPGWVHRQPLAAALVAGFVALAAVAAWLTVFQVRSEGQRAAWHAPVRGEEVISSEGEVLVEDLAVEEGGHLLVRASRSVAFGNGFKVGPGGRLTVEAGGSTASTRQ